MLKIGRFYFKLSFFVLALLMFFLKLYLGFLILFLSVSLHEIGHILIAKLFGLRCEKIIITALGQMAVINKIETIEWRKRLLIYFVGPLVNFVFYLVCFFREGEIFLLISYINLSIGLFNLLPVFPLDGGRILRVLLSKRIGILNANKIVFKVSLIFSVLLVILGIIQILLYPFNLSLFCIGFYLIKANQQEKIKLTFEFYKMVLNKKAINSNSTRRIRVEINEGYKKVLNNISLDYNLIIELYEKENFITQIEEKQFFDFLYSNF